MIKLLAWCLYYIICSWNGSLAIVLHPEKEGNKSNLSKYKGKDGKLKLMEQEQIFLIGRTFSVVDILCKGQKEERDARILTLISP